MLTDMKFTKSLITTLLLSSSSLSLADTASRQLSSHFLSDHEVSRFDDNEAAYINYLLYTPESYDDAGRADDNFPLLVFLHGDGEKASTREAESEVDINKLKNIGIAKLITQNNWPQDREFIVLSLQCKVSCGGHNPHSIKQAIDLIKNQYRIDASRVYMTGLSKGAASTNEFAVTYPNVLSAIVPIAGWGVGSYCNINKTGVWTLHNKYDGVVGSNSSESTYYNINKCSGREAETHITIYDSSGHNSWDKTYTSNGGSLYGPTTYTNVALNQDNTIYDFFLRHSRPELLNGEPDEINHAPVLSSINSFALNVEQVLEISLQASDTNNDVLSYAIADAPAFASLSGNTLLLSPTLSDAGDYNFTISVSDSELSDQQNVELTVNSLPDEEDVSEGTSYQVNFTKNISTDSQSWNAFFYDQRGSDLVLVDKQGEQSTITLSLANDFCGASEHGQTANDLGVMPDKVLRSYWFMCGDTVGEFNLSGLKTSSQYQVEITASRKTNDDRVTTYQLSGQQTQELALNAKNNSSESVIFTQVNSDSNGELNLQLSSDHYYSYINGLILTELKPAEQDGEDTSAPALTLSGESTVNVNLGETYTDLGASAIDNIDGFVTVITEGQVDTSNTGEYILTYSATDSSGNQASIERLVIVSETNTNAEIININFAAASSPSLIGWNNLYRTSSAPYPVINLVNKQGETSDILLSQGSSFCSSRLGGASTSNNSGVMPDAVLDSFWYTCGDSKEHVVLSGLQNNASYKLTIMASRLANNSRISEYDINGQTQQLEAQNNSANTISFDNLNPDENGELKLDIYRLAELERWGYINGLILEQH